MFRSFMIGASHRALFAAPDADGGQAADTGPDAEGAGKGAGAADTGAAGDGETPPPTTPDAASGAGDKAADGDQTPFDALPHWTKKELEKRKRKAAELSEENKRLRELLEAQDRQRAAAADAGAAADTGDAGAGQDQQRQPAHPGRQQRSQSEIDAEINARAEQIAEKTQFDRDCEEVWKKGQATYGKDWDRSMGMIRDLGGLPDDKVLREVLSTDDPAKVMHELGSNPETFQRIMELPAGRRMAELVKLSLTAPPQKKVSEAPPPVNQVGGRGSTSDELNADDDDATWYAKRAKQKAASKGRPWSPAG